MQLLDSQILLVASVSVPDSAYRISLGVETLDPRIVRMIARIMMLIFSRLVLLAFP